MVRERINIADVCATIVKEFNGNVEVKVPANYTTEINANSRKLFAVAKSRRAKTSDIAAFKTLAEAINYANTICEEGASVIIGIRTTLRSGYSILAICSKEVKATESEEETIILWNGIYKTEEEAREVRRNFFGDKSEAELDERFPLHKGEYKKTSLGYIKVRDLEVEKTNNTENKTNKIDNKMEKINRTIWDILEECDLTKSYEIGGGWALQYIHNNSDSIWDWGIALGKIEDGEFEEETDFRIGNYCETLADILYQGSQIVESMANDIEEYINQK